MVRIQFEFSFEAGSKSVARAVLCLRCHAVLGVLAVLRCARLPGWAAAVLHCAELGWDGQVYCTVLCRAALRRALLCCAVPCCVAGLARACWVCGLGRTGLGLLRCAVYAALRQAGWAALC